MKRFFLCATFSLFLMSCGDNEIKTDSEIASSLDHTSHTSQAAVGTDKDLLAELSEAALRGHNIYKYWCATCHGRGQGKPGTMALSVKYEGELPALLEHREDLPKDVLTHFIRNGISVMPSFRPTEVSDQDISDMAEYLAASSNYQAGQNK